MLLTERPKQKLQNSVSTQGRFRDWTDSYNPRITGYVLYVALLSSHSGRNIIRPHILISVGPILCLLKQ